MSLSPTSTPTSNAASAGASTETGASGSASVGQGIVIQGVEFPADSKVASSWIKGQLDASARKLEMGVLGSFLGGASEKAGNIAFVVIVVLLLAFLGVLVFAADTPSLTKKDMLLSITGVLTLVLGYLFGRSSRS